MQLVYRLVRAVAHLALALAALAMLASLALVCYAVFMRYVLDTPVPWTDELVGYLLVAMVMLAAADALLEGEHISVDIVTDRLSGRGKRGVLLVGLVAVALVGALILLQGAGMIAFDRMVGLRSNGELAAPMWLPHLFIPIGGGLLLAAALVGLWHTWRDPDQPPRPDRLPRGLE
jgi:TRAP-type C4-dicarboxylate transport system permease small subunit